MATILMNSGYNVLQARDGGAAMKVVTEHKISVALVDLHMAPTGGFDFIDFLREKEYKIPVVVITGDQGTDLLLKAKQHGVLQLLTKPVEPDRLKKLVARVIEKIYG